VAAAGAAGGTPREDERRGAASRPTQGGASWDADQEREIVQEPEAVEGKQRLGAVVTTAPLCFCACAPELRIDLRWLEGKDVTRIFSRACDMIFT